MNTIIAAMLAISLAATTQPAATAQSLPIKTTAHPQEATEVSQAEEIGVIPEEEYIGSGLLEDFSEIEGEQGRGTIKNLEGYFYENGYPEFISYLSPIEKYMDKDKNLAVIFTVGLTDMSQENRDYLLDLADTTCWLVFEAAEYSFNQLDRVRQELVAMNTDDFGVFMYYNDDVVNVEVWDEALLEKYRTMFSEKYGDMVKVTYGLLTGEYDMGMGEIGDGVTGALPPTIGAQQSSTAKTALIAAVCSALAVMLAAGAFLIIRRRIRISADGTAAVTLSKAGVEQLIKDSAEAPPSELKDKIMNRIK